VNEEEQMIVKGEAAEVLLGTEAFSNTIDQMVQGTFQTFVNSKPEQTESRERAYSHYRALVDIVSTLREQVSVKDEIITKNAERNNSKEVE
jgi:hypothetical protein